ncbi:MAG: discoidin domain-containing protein, partial [Kiritimatiellia bacterium]
MIGTRIMTTMVARPTITADEGECESWVCIMKHTQNGKHVVSRIARAVLAGLMLVTANGATGAEDEATLTKARDAERETISLDGQRQIAEGSMDKMPAGHRREQTTMKNTARANEVEGEYAGYEYAAGEVILPFSYSITRSTAPQPEGLNFSKQPNPDNCMVFVRMGAELYEFRSQWILSLLKPPTPGFDTSACYVGPDIDHLKRVENSPYPNGMTMCWFLGGMWYDESEGKLYAPMHVEPTEEDRHHPVMSWGSRKIALATSTDKGKTWRLEGDIITSETYFYTHDAFKYSGSDYGNGVSDFGFYTDTRGGYFYIFPDEGWSHKGSGAMRWNVRVARCAISDKMAPGKWKYFYNGKWEEPALGGKSSAVAPSHFWGVIYSSYLDKYICMFPANQDPLNAQNLDGVYIGACSDLGKQDWVWGYCPEASDFFGFCTVMNSEGTDVIACGQTFRYYSYFANNSFQRLDVKLERGQTIATDLRGRYLFEAHPESSDPLQGRKTKIIGAASPEMKYSGPWDEHANADSYEGKTRESAGVGASVEFAFEGADVYWRALRSPASGKADVYIDGVLRKTVDCYSPRSTSFEEFMYIRTGLVTNKKHVIKIVVKGDKHPKSASAAINHIAFEYAAESYKASAGFSSVMGKNNWYYQQGTGARASDLRFVPDAVRSKMYWFDNGNCRVGSNYQIPDSQDAVRQWVAPHGGVVRIEGTAAVDKAGGNGVMVSIQQNSNKLWPARVLSPGQPAAHDLTVNVEQGDALSFIAAKNDPAAKSTNLDLDKVTWDPVITYTKSVPAVWRPNAPSERNLAIGKYARSKILLSTYRPFAGVDGDPATAYVIKADDKISSGDDWFAVDLDKPYMIDRYVFVSKPDNPAYRPAAFTLQRSDDGFAWTDVDTVTGNTSDRVERNVAAFRARYVRLYLPKGKPFAINEVELYHTGAKAAAPAKGISAAAKTVRDKI